MKKLASSCMGEPITKLTIHLLRHKTCRLKQQEYLNNKNNNKKNNRKNNKNINKNNQKHGRNKQLKNEERDEQEKKPKEDIHRTCQEKLRMELELTEKRISQLEITQNVTVD